MCSIFVRLTQVLGPDLQDEKSPASRMGVFFPGKTKKLREKSRPGKTLDSPIFVSSGEIRYHRSGGLFVSEHVFRGQLPATMKGHEHVMNEKKIGCPTLSDTKLPGSAFLAVVLLVDV